MHTRGFIRSIRVTTPLWVTGFRLSYSAVKEWCAQTGAAASSKPAHIMAPPTNTDFIMPKLPLSTRSVYSPSTPAARHANKQVFCYNRIMQDRQVINDSYYCGRFRQDSVVSVLTGNSYVVAEYDERTGDIRWQRVVNASQKEGIYNWLRDHFPVKVVTPETPKKPSRKTQLASA